MSWQSGRLQASSLKGKLSHIILAGVRDKMEVDRAHLAGFASTPQTNAVHLTLQPL